jgi:hypothetical protein
MTTFERIQALIELKEKGAISDLEFKQMLELIEAEGDTTTPKKTVQPEKQKKANETSSRVKEDIAALREKEILEQVIGAYEKKDWKMLRAKYELLKDKAAVSLEITTALFAFERRQIWLEKEEQAKKEEEKQQAISRKKKNLLGYGIAVLLILGICGYVFQNAGSDEARQPKFAKKEVKVKEEVKEEKEQSKDTSQIQKPILPKPRIDKKKQTTAEQIKVGTQLPENKNTEEAQKTEQNQEKIAEDGVLQPFPEYLIQEAEALCAKIKNQSFLEDEKKIAADRARSIHKKYVIEKGKIWLSDKKVDDRLLNCALIYKAL